jgi:hypothetical protein
MLFNGTEMGSDITAQCQVAAGGFVGWRWFLVENIGGGLVLKVGTGRESGGRSYDRLQQNNLACHCRGVFLLLSE